MAKASANAPKSQSCAVGASVVEIKDPDQHEKAARHRVEDEFHGGVHTARTSPDPDQEVHRNEHDLPEDVEEEEIERGEDPDHSGLEQEEGDHVGLHPGRDGEGEEDRDRREKRGQ
jgi:hypothetical protein